LGKDDDDTPTGNELDLESTGADCAFDEIDQWRL
jgi:hypothetical protein